MERAVDRLLREARDDAKIEGMANDILKHEPTLLTVYAGSVAIAPDLALNLPREKSRGF